MSKTTLIAICCSWMVMNTSEIAAAKTKTATPALSSARDTASTEADDSTNLKQQAEKEIDAPSQNKNPRGDWNSDSPSGFLILDDPGLQTNHRTFNWRTLLQARSTNLGGRNLVIPEIGLGVDREFSDSNLGVQVNVGATSSKESYTFPTGYSIDDVKLVSTTLATEIFYGVTRSKWNYTGGIGWLQMTQSQTSSTDSARFNHSLRTIYGRGSVARRFGQFDVGLALEVLAKSGSDDLYTDTVQPLISASYLW